MKSFSFKFIFLFLSLFSISTLQAQETNIMIGVKAKDAKFIDSSIFVAEILVKNAEIQEILGKRFPEGRTGKTKIIMKNTHEKKKCRNTKNFSKSIYGRQHRKYRNHHEKSS